MRNNLVLVFGSLLLAFAAVEAAVRLLDTNRQRETIEQLNPNKPLNRENHALLGELLRPSKFKDIIYELRPNLDTNFLGARVQSNAQGFRGDLCEDEKQKNEIRIVGIGDSLMFGWGVPSGHEYLALLKDKLVSSKHQFDWRVTNTAVPGYNTRLEVETLRLKALKCKPDIVILGFLESNDFELPHFVHSNNSLPLLGQSALLGLIKRRLELLTKSDFIDSIDTLSSLSKKHLFQVIVYAHEAVEQETLNLFEARDFKIVQTWPHIIGELKKTGATYRDSAFVLSANDMHPSIQGHRLAAEILVAEFDDHFLLKTLIPKRMH